MIETKLETITPDLAEELLKCNINNRSVSSLLVAKYASDMASGNWAVTHQGIALYDDYTIADGQHRLLAIVKSNSTVQRLVSYNLPKETAIDIDVHRPRSMIDGILIGGLSDWITARHISMASFLTSPTRLSTQQTVEFLESIKKSAKFSIEHLSANRRYLTHNVIYSAVCLAHLNGVNPSRLARFCSVYYTGNIESKEENSVIRLRDEFMSNTNAGWNAKQEKFFKAQRAIQAFIAEEPLSRLIAPKASIYKLGQFGK